MLGIESDDVVNYLLPEGVAGRPEQHVRYIGEWLKTEARYLGS